MTEERLPLAELLAKDRYPDCTRDTRLGSLQRVDPRCGSTCKPRRTSEKALVAVIQAAWVSGVSTRRVDDLVQAVGLAGIGKSTALRQAFVHPDRPSASQALRHVADQLRAK